MSKNSRKLWKAYLHFPYDLMKLHTFEKSLSIYSHVNFIHPKSSHLGYSCPLISNTALLHLPLVKAYALTTNPRSDLAQRSMQTRRFNLITAIPFSPKPHHHLHICLRELATFRTPTANRVLELWNDTKIKRKSTCALVCKKAAATFSNLD